MAKILFATAHPFLPQMVGGLQRSSAQLAMDISQRGHDVAFLSALMDTGYYGLRGRIALKVTGRKAVLDTAPGFRVYRSWFPWEAMTEVVARERADLVIVMAVQSVKMAKAAQSANVPIIMMLQDVEFNDLGGDFASLGTIRCVANSKFTAQAYRKRFGIEADVIHPIVEREKYLVNSSRENITFFNPNPKKGLDIAIEVARLCPEEKFEFVETWPLEPEQKAELDRRLAGLTNITFTPPVADAREVYRRSKLVMIPSRWHEAFGRVALEPQISGIPVIATHIGGLPESAGENAVLIDPEAGPDVWATQIRRMSANRKYYAELSQAALAHSSRPEFNREYQVQEWLRAIGETISVGTKAHLATS